MIIGHLCAVARRPFNGVSAELQSTDGAAQSHRVPVSEFSHWRRQQQGEIMDFSEVYSDTVGSVSASARSGSVVQVRRLIRSGHSVDVKDNRGWNSLHEAAARGNRGCVREILRAAASSSGDLRSFVNSQTHEGETPLFLAARDGHRSVVKLLLRAKADINLQTNDLSCPLYAAVDGGHTETVTLLALRGAEVNRSHTASCWTCLHQAVYKGHSEIVSVLTAVADLESVDDHSITPLFVAAQYGRLDCLRTLIDAGACVDVQAADGATPLLISSQEGHQDCVGLLLAHGADPNLSCSSEWPQLPIHAAAQFGHIGILKKLIPLTDRSCGHAPGQVSPLYLAIQSDQRGALEVLLGQGFSPDAQDCEELLGLRSPLSQALALAATHTHRSVEMVKLLLSTGASLHKDTWTCLLKADKPDLLQLVLDFRTIPGPSPHRAVSGSPRPKFRRDLSKEETRDLVQVCLNQTETGLMWMPLLLNEGLDPNLLLQRKMCKDAPGCVLNLLLQYLNWSCVRSHLRLTLERRQTERTWEPLTLFDSIPSLSHLCRLQIRTVLGSALLMRTTVIHHLPVPVPLHHFLQFRDIQPTL